MAVHGLQRGQLKRPKKQASKLFRVPAPYKGLDGRVPIAAGALDTCTYTFNLVPNDGGLELRKGYREWQIGVDDGGNLGATTIMPFNGLAADGSDDRLFAVNNEGIWDVTTPGAAPVIKFTFADQTDAAGYGVFIAYITDGGVKTMMYADSKNGLFTYDVATTTWAQTVGITGPTTTNINFIAVHKQRIWLIEEDAADSWYLGIGAITGAATKFAFGSKMKSGGALRGLFNWSIDGGAGVDDLFVGVSGAGDVVVYQGDDPGAAATWELRGVYFIGALPVGPKFGTNQGGELFLLSVYGLIGMSDLLKGVSVTSGADSGVTAPITSLLRNHMLTTREVAGWAVRDTPSEGGIVIDSPTLEGQRPIQYYYDHSIRGWGLWRDLAMTAFGTWRDAVVFGDADGRILYMDQEADNVLLTPPAPPAVNATAIEFSTLTSFSAFEKPGVFKRVHYVRPDFIGVAAPEFTAAPRFDYSTIEAGSPLATAPAKVGLWDIDSWDSAVWGASTAEGWGFAYGGFGVGRYCAVAVRGFAYSKIILAGFDVIYDHGGPML
jgi:hypothetical protein